MLEIDGITKTFGSLTANDRISFRVERGTVHALLGENGAGKSTLMNVLYGLYRPDSGRILLRDRPVTFHSPRDAIRAGIGMIHQHFMLVPPLSVSENIVLGYDPAHPTLAEPADRGARDSRPVGGLWPRRGSAGHRVAAARRPAAARRDPQGPLSQRPTS